MKRIGIILLCTVLLASLVWAVAACQNSTPAQTAEVDLTVTGILGMPDAQIDVRQAVITLSVEAETFDLSRLQPASEGITVAAYGDAAKTKTLSGEVALTEGDNTFYVVLSAEGRSVTYVLRIHCKQAETDPTHGGGSDNPSGAVSHIGDEHFRESTPATLTMAELRAIIGPCVDRIALAFHPNADTNALWEDEYGFLPAMLFVLNRLDMTNEQLETLLRGLVERVDAASASFLDDMITDLVETRDAAALCAVLRRYLTEANIRQALDVVAYAVDNLSGNAAMNAVLQLSQGSPSLYDAVSYFGAEYTPVHYTMFRDYMGNDAGVYAVQRILRMVADLAAYDAAFLAQIADIATRAIPAILDGGIAGIMAEGSDVSVEDMITLANGVGRLLSDMLRANDNPADFARGASCLLEGFCRLVFSDECDRFIALGRPFLDLEVVGAVAAFLSDVTVDDVLKVYLAFDAMQKAKGEQYDVKAGGLVAQVARLIAPYYARISVETRTAVGALCYQGDFVADVDALLALATDTATPTDAQKADVWTKAKAMMPKLVPMSRILGGQEKKDDAPTLQAKKAYNLVCDLLDYKQAALYVVTDADGDHWYVNTNSYVGHAAIDWVDAGAMAVLPQSPEGVVYRVYVAYDRMVFEDGASLRADLARTLGLSDGEWQVQTMADDLTAQWAYVGAQTYSFVIATLNIDSHTMVVAHASMNDLPKYYAVIAANYGLDGDMYVYLPANPTKEDVAKALDALGEYPYVLTGVQDDAKLYCRFADVPFEYAIETKDGRPTLKLYGEYLRTTYIPVYYDTEDITVQRFIYGGENYRYPLGITAGEVRDGLRAEAHSSTSVYWYSTATRTVLQTWVEGNVVSVTLKEEDVSALGTHYAYVTYDTLFGPIHCVQKFYIYDPAEQ